MRRPSIWRGPCLAAAFVVMFLSADVLRAGALIYPAPGNLRLDEGTIEVWFTPMASELYPPADGEKYLNIFSLFRIDGSPDFNCACAWYRHGNQIGLKVSLSDREMKDGLVAVLTNTPKTWRPGEAHQVAFTWKGTETAVYADGKLIGSRRQMGRLRGAVGPLKLVIGQENNAQIIVNAVRVSSSARAAAELAQPPRADLNTLLLDRFDGPIEKGATKAAVISGMSGETGARIQGAARRVAVPTAGLALYKEK